MRERLPRIGARCAVRPAERIGRGAVSAFLALFALSSLDNLWCAVPAAVCAFFLVIGAITGWCPTDLLTRPRAPEENTLGYAEARQRIDL